MCSYKADEYICFHSLCRETTVKCPKATEGVSVKDMISSSEVI